MSILEKTSLLEIPTIETSRLLLKPMRTKFITERYLHWMNDLDDDDEGTHLFQPCLEDLKGAAYRAYLDSEDAVLSPKS